MEIMDETMTDMELRMRCLELAVQILSWYSHKPNVSPTEIAGKLFDFVKDGKDTMDYTLRDLPFLHLE